MEFLLACVDFIIHLNVHLAELITNYDRAVYGILFAIVFAETGLVIAPFLPGDSLLFAAGSLSAVTVLSPHWLCLTLIVACTCGDNLNYWIGRFVGERCARSNRWVKVNHIKQTEAFYKKYGGTAIFLARFIPIVRTFTPFVAGVARMPYPKFVILSILAASVWVCLLTYLGFFFGNIPFVKEHLSSIMLGIIVVSLLPLVLKMIQLKYKNRKKPRTQVKASGNR